MVKFVKFQPMICITRHSSLFMAGVGRHRREIFFIKNFTDSNHGKSNWNILPNLKYQLTNKYPPLTKNLHSVVTHVLYHFWHEFDNCLFNILQSKVSDVVCTCTFLKTSFASWQIGKWSIDWLIDWLIDLDIVLTDDCWHCLLVFNTWVSHVLEMTINFITQPLSCFVFHLPNLLLT
jgi:hypothetical protein